MTAIEDPFLSTRALSTCTPRNFVHGKFETANRLEVFPEERAKAGKEMGRRGYWLGTTAFLPLVNAVLTLYSLLNVFFGWLYSFLAQQFS